MRISDWSSDVCSSDLIKEAGGKVLGSSRYAFPGTDFASFLLSAQSSGAQGVALASAGSDLQNEIKQANEFGLTETQKIVAMLMSITDVHGVGLDAAKNMNFAETFYWNLDDESRSEEHTSELHSLMRISYAVFCLNQKNMF